MKLPQYQNWSFDNKKSDFVSLMNTNFKRESVGYQRMRLKEILRSINSKNRIIEGRFSKKNYYKALRNSKVSIGAYGWGEVCYREFEAINCGAAILFPDMSNIYHAIPNLNTLTVHTVGPERFDSATSSKVVLSEAVGLIAPLWHYVRVKVYAKTIEV